MGAGGGYLHIGSVMAWSWVPRYSPRWDSAVTTLSLATKRWTPWGRGWGREGDMDGDMGTWRWDMGTGRGDMGMEHGDGVGDMDGDTGMGLGTGRDMGMGLGT